jgi:Na+-transporting NADH:ubiquinone oxidoreductase subunit NqrB
MPVMLAMATAATLAHPPDTAPLSPPATPATRVRIRAFDPRLYQIGALSALLAYGLAVLDLDVRPERVVLILATAVLVQYACTRAWRLPAFDPRSALISGLSLCLLLRTNGWRLAAAGALLAVASKFALRVRGKHVFNPTNFAIVVLLASGQAWVSPGQWGSAAFFGFLLVCVGGLVVNRAARSDVTLAFLVLYGGLVVGRSVWLGEPLAIPLHRLQSGALLIFAFFMISDPRTTPDARAARLAFAALVALGAAWVQFRLFRTNGLLWSLFFASLLVPVLDRMVPGPRHAWPSPRRRVA